MPIVFTVGEQRFAIKSATLGVEPDWSAALATALREGSGFAPVRGYKRLQSRFLGTDIVPPVRVYTAALEYKLGQIADAVDRRHVEAKLVRRGLAVAVVPGQVGRTLERKAAANTIVRALAGLERGKPVALPVVVDPIDVTAADLALVAKQARVALSAPVRLVYGETRWKLPRWRLAQLIELPSGSSTRLSIAGKQADAWFARLRKRVDRAPADARFATSSGAISIVPSKPGLAVEVPATAAAILAAAVSPSNRTAQLVVGTSEPKLTTADARGLGIERRLGTYTTLNAGTYNRITNLRRAIELLSGALVAPGATFSFNDRVGPRTVERGFLPAPVIIRDEYEEDVGGGVSQVATTVFNAAWESGVKVAERNPHSLYISRYQLGRDATVNFPDLDLKFVNDTPKWILVAASWDGGGITVSLYGGGPERRVESGEGTMKVTGPARLRSHAGSDARGRHGGRRGGGIRGARHERHANGLRREGLRPPRRDLEHVLSRRVPDRPRRDEAKAGSQAQAEGSTAADCTDDDRPDDDRTDHHRARGSAGHDSALATASTNQAGTRVGRASQGIHGGVRSRAFRDQLRASLDRVLVAKASAAEVDAARPDPQPVVEVRRLPVRKLHLGRQRLDSLGPDREIAARVLRQIGDARNLEPDHERGVMSDPLRVRLGEADGHLRREVEALHPTNPTIGA